MTGDAVVSPDLLQETGDLPVADWMQSRLTADELPTTFTESFAAGRIWLGFMTARVMVGVLLLVLQSMAYHFGAGVPVWLLALCVAYLVATVVTRLWVAPVRLGTAFERHWPYTVGIDLVFYFLLSWHGENALVNYLPLLAFPPLVCAVLGSWRITLTTVLLAMMLMTWEHLHHYTVESGHPYMVYAQMSVFSLGLLVVTFLLHRLTNYMGLQQFESYSSRQLARLRGRITGLVMQNVTDGVMVVSRSGRIRALNQAAQGMLRLPAGMSLPGRDMASMIELGTLSHLVAQSFEEGEGLSAEVLLLHAQGDTPHLMVRTQLSRSASQDEAQEDLCLLYIQDMQQVQDQLRTEKLAAMGRMSAAVAHEIRNPLSAIAQAAELLGEELDQPLQKRLNEMVQTNAQRLGRVVEDVLDIARTQQQLPQQAEPLFLDTVVHQLVQEWAAQHADAVRPVLTLGAPDASVVFDAEHLRRVLVNLLDNAALHSQQGAQARVLVQTWREGGRVHLQVWSRGAAMEAAVQARLFEPFASGRSRSTGLGLYICRELCQRNGAAIHYQRIATLAHPLLQAEEQHELGHAFVIDMPQAASPEAQPGAGEAVRQ